MMIDSTKFDNREEEIIKVYKDVLSGKRKQFPKGYWSPDDVNAKARYRICFRWYIFEYNVKTRDEIAAMDIPQLREIRLASALSSASSKLFRTMIELLTYCVDDLAIQPLDMPRCPRHYWNPETIKYNLRAVVHDHLKLDLRGIQNIPDKVAFLHANRIWGAYIAYVRIFPGEDALYSMFSFAFPEYDFDKSMFQSGRDVTADIIDMLHSGDVIPLYKEVLDGARGKLPASFWTSASYGEADNLAAKERAKACIRYYAYNRKGVSSRSAIRRVMSIAGLRSANMLDPTRKVFDSVYDMAIYCFPEHGFGPDDFRQSVAIKKSSVK